MPLDRALVTEFVNNAHGNLPRVRELLAAHPDLLHERSQLGESALAAAAHVGNRAIAEFLIEAGAPVDVCTAAMLARRDEVERVLEADPAQARATGAHGIPLMAHVALGGDVAIAEMVLARDPAARLDGALHGAVAFGHLEMVRWLLSRDAEDVNTPNWQKKTPLAVAVERGHGAVAELLRQHGAHE